MTNVLYEGGPKDGKHEETPDQEPPRRIDVEGILDHTYRWMGTWHYLDPDRNEVRGGDWYQWYRQSPRP